MNYFNFLLFKIFKAILYVYNVSILAAADAKISEALNKNIK